MVVVRRLLALAMLLAPALADAQCGTAKGPAGEPAWAMTGDSRNGWQDREAYRCVTVCGGTWEMDRPAGYLWCSRASATEASRSATPGVDALVAVVAAQATGQPVDATTQGMAVGAAAFDLGAALHDYLAAESANGRAQAAAQAAARAAAERRRAEEDARQREASWQRLNNSMMIDDPAGDLAPKLEGDESADLGLKLGEKPIAVAATDSFGYARGVMPRRSAAAGKVKIRRYTPSDPPPAPAKPAAAQVGAKAACASVGPARLVDGTVRFMLDATGCPKDQHCQVEIEGMSAPRGLPVLKGARGELDVGALPAGVTIHDYEKVKRVRKACRPLG